MTGNRSDAPTGPSRAVDPQAGKVSLLHTPFLGMCLGAALVLICLPAGDAMAGGKPCARTSFQTELVKQACAKGGQKSAKKAMKDWVKDAKKKKAGLECATCHSDMAPGYELKPEGLKLFQELGGK